MLFTTTPEKCFFNAPFHALQNDHLDLFIKNRLQPEIGLEGDVLYRCRKQEFEEVADALQQNNLSTTLHAPFFDLAPGALDDEILAVTRNKLHKAFDLIDIFQPKAIICHLNYEDNKHGYKADEWFAAASETWRELLYFAQSRRTPLMLENTYEFNPQQHIKMLRHLNSPLAGFCLDTGHVNSFAQSTWQQWLPSMNTWLQHLHLHDNDGSSDQHLAIGSGNFDFYGLLNYLDKQKISPLITMEPHSEDDLWQTIEALAKMKIVNLM